MRNVTKPNTVSLKNKRNIKYWFCVLFKMMNDEKDSNLGNYYDDKLYSY